MNTPKCSTCRDTGHRDPSSFDLDCTDCDVAEQRNALNQFADMERRKTLYIFDLYWAIHQRALAMGISASVEDILNEMQPGGALHMPQEPVAHLKFLAAQSWSGNGNHDVESGEGLEVCKPGEIGADGLPAFPVFLHAIPGSLAMAPKQEAPQPAPEIRTVLRDALASGLTLTYGCSRVWSAWGVGTMTEDDFYPADECDELLDELCDLAIAALRPDLVAPAAANGAPEPVDALNAALQQAAGELPDGYTIRVEVEQGAGWVEWSGGDAEGAIDHDGLLADEVLQALADAKEHAAAAGSAA